MIEIIGAELYQWDTGRSVSVKDVGADKVHFANQGDSRAVIIDVEDSVAKIPDYLLQTGKQLCVYAVANGVTIESKIFSVKKRERPENYVYEEDQRNYIYELIQSAEDATAEAKEVAEELRTARDNGEFVGPQGPQGPQGEIGPQGPEGPPGNPGDQNVAIFKYKESTFDEVKVAYDAGKLCILLYEQYQLPLFSLSGTTFTFKTQDTGKQQNCWLQPSGWGHAENTLVTNARATQIEEDLSWAQSRADEAWTLANTADGVANIALSDAGAALLEASDASADAASAVSRANDAMAKAEEAVMVAEDTVSNIKVIKIPNAEKGGVGGTLVLQENTYYQFIGGTKKTLRLYNADGTTVGYEKQYQILNIYCGSVDDVDEFGAAREVKTVKTAYAAFVGMNTDINISDVFSDASKFFESGSLAMRKVGDDGTEYGNRCEIDYPANSTIIIQTKSA